MVSLARSTLVYDWKRFLSAVIALAFSALLIHVQIGVALGEFYTLSQFLEKSNADLWVTSHNVKSFNKAWWVDPKLEFQFKTHPEVAICQGNKITFGWIKTDTSAKNIGVLTNIDNDNNKSIAFSKEFLDEFQTKLEFPRTVVLEKSAQKELDVNIGDDIEFFNKRVRIIGFTDSYKAHNYNGYTFYNFFCSPSTFYDIAYRRWGWMGSERLKYFLLKLKDPKLAIKVRDELNAKANKKYKVWTRKDMFWGSQKHILWESDQNTELLFSAILSVIIGIVITQQSLKGVILASVRDYSAIRALGVSRWSLSKVVLEQSFWVGIAGLLVGLTLTGGVGYATDILDIDFAIPYWIFIFSVPLIIITSLIAGLFSLLTVYKTQPAELLR